MLLWHGWDGRGVLGRGAWGGMERLETGRCHAEDKGSEGGEGGRGVARTMRYGHHYKPFLVKLFTPSPKPEPQDFGGRVGWMMESLCERVLRA